MSDDMNAPAVGDVVPPQSAPNLPQAPPAMPTQAAPAQPSMWRQVLQGAMAGLAGSSGSTSFGGGLAGGAKGELAQQQLKKENDLQAQAQASTIKFRDAQSASLVAEAANNNAKALALPQQAKDAHDASELEKLKTFNSLGLSPIAVADDHADAAHSALEGITKQHGAVPPLANVEVGGQHYAFDLSQLAKGPQSLTLINEARQASGQDALTPAVMAQMSPASKEQELSKATTFFSPSAPSNAKEAHGNLLQYQAFASAYKNNPNADPKIAEKLDGTVKRLATIDQGMAADARKDKGEEAFSAGYNQAKGRLQAEAEQQPQWVPKATNDEKKKAELAENIAENANQAAVILKSRPEIFGPSAGRYTAVEQLIGNNDPDISKLGVVIHNIAMANSGVHGFRAHEGVKDTEKIILNNFKNGPQAVANSLLGLTRSTQTFIDNARPENYKTHSKNGGAIRAMGAN